MVSVEHGGQAGSRGHGIERRVHAEDEQAVETGGIVRPEPDSQRHPHLERPVEVGEPAGGLPEWGRPAFGDLGAGLGADRERVGDRAAQAHDAPLSPAVAHGDPAIGQHG